MRHIKGFTLIELIVVIVILGILAVTAAPKFIDLQSDARKATLKGAKGAMHSAVTLIRGKAILQGKDKTASGSTIVINGSTSVSLVYGYPDATVAGIGNALDMETTVLTKSTSECTTEWCSYSEEGVNKYYYLIPEGKSSTTCSVVYTKDASATAPTITVNTDNC